MQLPEAAELVDGLKPSLRNAHQNLAAAAFDALSAFVGRCSAESEPAGETHRLRRAKYLIEHAAPQVIERVGDSKEKARTAAGHALIEIGVLSIKHSDASHAHGKGKGPETLQDIFLHLFRDHALKSKSPRTREHVRGPKAAGVLS